MYPSSPHKTAQIPCKRRSNSLENLTHYYLLMCGRKRHSTRNMSWESSCWPITRSGSSHVDEMFTA